MVDDTLPEAFARTFRNYAVDGVPASGKHDVSKREARNLGAVIQQRLGVALGAVTVAKATRANLNADLAHGADTLALVYGDSVDADNDLYVKTGGSGTGGWTNTGALHGIIEGLAQPYVDEIESLISLRKVFVEGATDEYAKRLIKDLTIEGGVPGRVYVLNYQTRQDGPTLFRVKLYIFDPVLAANVAIWEFEASSDPTDDLPEQIPLTLAADGSTPYPNYQGVTATVHPDWSQIDWSKVLTTYEDATETGIRPENIRTDEQLADFGDRPTLVVTAGPTGADFTDAQAAVESLQDRNLSNSFGRQTFPNSFRSTPSFPALIEVLGGDHEIIPETVDYDDSPSIDTGLVPPQYAILRGRPGARLFMDTPEKSAPVVEANWPCVIEGLEIEQFGPGYGLHIDPGNVIWKRAVSGPAVLSQRPRWVLRDLTIRVHGEGSASAAIGAGMPNGGVLVLERVNLLREAGTAPLLICHTSPNTTDPGLIIIKDCRFNDEDVVGGKALQLIKSDAMTVQHKIIILNSELGTVEALTQSGGGAPGWQRQGRFDGSFDYSPYLDPA